MSAVPGNLDTDAGPPMTVPLRHFLVGLGFLLAGIAAGLALFLGVLPGRGTLVHVHLLLAGWVCVTIMGAMTQFVPVWSGTALHSRRLAGHQLVLVTGGLVGLVTALLLGAFAALVVAGVVLLAGFWTFAYNLGRTLATLSTLDVTEGHFAFALVCFVVLTSLGLLLAIDLATPILAGLPIQHSGLRGAHVTVAVFGAVLSTVYGALYQLGTMFTGTTLDSVDEALQTVEWAAHPVGVVLLAAGRLVDAPLPARAGGVLLVVAAVALAVILARQLVGIQVEWHPMHTRYAVAAAALVAWAALTLPAWLTAPTADAALLGAPGAVHLLVLGAIGFVVFGTLYHIVPFIVWVDRYSDRVGLEPVPMVDDLYDDRLAAVDGALLVAGTALLVMADVASLGTAVAAAGGILVATGVGLFCVTVGLVLRRHSPTPLATILLGDATTNSARAAGEETGTDRP